MSPGDFPDWVVALGEEGSDPLVPHQGGVVRVDEYASSGHYDRLDEDLAAVAGLGVTVWRYGMPWRLTEPDPGRYDWTLWDRAFAACERHGLTPVVDLCHFGLPDHLAGGFGDPAWVDAFERYVDAFLARYPGPRWFTPVNEPFITAFHSGLMGMWNEAKASTADFGRALVNVVAANVGAIHRIRADRDGWWIGAEGFVVPLAPPDAPEAADEMRAVSHLVWDLHLGVEPRAAGQAVLDQVPDAMRDRIVPLTDRERMVCGHDVYPTSIVPVGGASMPSPEERLDLYAAEARSWFDRYGAPFWVAETSNLSLPVDQQVPWLEGMVRRLGDLRRDGLPVRGVCWYSRGDQYDWDSSLTQPVGRVTEVGLFDAERRPRPVAEAYARLAASPPPG